MKGRWGANSVGIRRHDLSELILAGARRYALEAVWWWECQRLDLQKSRPGWSDHDVRPLFYGGERQRRT